MISFSEIFKQAFFLLRNKKFVWGLGLFLFWNTALNAVSYVVNTGGSPSYEFNFGIRSAAVVLILAICFALLFFRARAGLIFATKSILEKKPTGFASSFSEGRKFQTRLFAIWIATMFLIAALGILLAVPVAYLYSMNFLSRAAILGLFALAIFIPVWVIANFVNNLAALFVVFFDMSASKAISASFDMIKKFWVLFLLFTVVLGMLTFVVEYVIILIGVKGVVSLAQIFYNTAGIHFTIGQILAGIVAIVAFLILSGLLAAYQQICWTLLFEKFVRAQKTEEAEIAPVPEVIS